MLGGKQGQAAKYLAWIGCLGSGESYDDSSCWLCKSPFVNQGQVKLKQNAWTQPRAVVVSSFPPAWESGHPGRISAPGPGSTGSAN